ncbi:PLP-dependent aminotransferase family protein [Paenibacillus rigui]|uniref:GntR family transcriptional regulator n=1 Tax=Paenibacillus rigui TaxID=554312 RepID=A0A229UJ55_9BACL|nr:PLP-dependent aminotransferase family protein [Paenibacillus rigui]OXM83412.1 GntR family transcriptional regulator [Paenibacillus rigui]
MDKLDWKPNRTSPLSLHIQIAQFIKDKIIHGEWPVGTKIPSQRKLADAFDVNRSTVVMALEELTADGFVEGNRGGGTTVAPYSWSQLTSNPPPDWTSYVRGGIQASNLNAVQEINEAEFRTDMIRLGTGELASDLLPGQQMRSILQSLSQKTIPLGYEEPKGNYMLRQQVAQYVKEYGITASPSSILIVSGALQALHLLSIGLLHRGSTVLLEKPSYLYSVPIFQSAGMRLTGLPMDEQGLQASLIPKYKKQFNGALLYTNPTFHNPTGIVMSPKRRDQLLEVCTAEGLPLIEDDVYRDLWIDTPPPQPLKAMNTTGSVLYVGSLSKTSSPGLRIGWVIGPEPVINRLADIKMQTDYESSALSQWAAAEWLSSGLYQEHIRFVREQLFLRRSIAMAALAKYVGTLGSWTTPSGGFYIWLRLPQAVQLHKLFETALREGIILNPGSLYAKDEQSFLRISYAYASLDDLDNGIARLASMIRRLL